jgi:hypothetical protein
MATRKPSHRALPRVGWLAIALQVFLGVGALLGGGALVLAPGGSILGMPVATLEGTPFSSFLIPGLILFGVLGVGSIASAALALARLPVAPIVSVAIGIALVIWISVQVAFIGFGHPIQALYFALGVAIAGAGAAWARPLVAARAA